MKAALEALDNVNVVRVKRCDAAYLPGRAGAEGWVGRCPFGHLGGYTWVVEFARPRREADADFLGKDVNVDESAWDERRQRVAAASLAAGAAPLLGVWKETITKTEGFRWTGPGAAVEIWRAENYVPCGVAEWEHPARAFGLGHGADGPAPPPPNCAFVAEGLVNAGGLYAFRVAAHNAAGWSEPGPPSRYRRLDAVAAPSRPSAPVWASLAAGRPEGTATVYASRPERPGSSNDAAPAASYDVQYRQDEGRWLSFGSVDADESGWATASLIDLDPERPVYARSRAVNAAGASPWSGASARGRVASKPIPAEPSRPLILVDDDARLVCRWLPTESGRRTVARSFEVQTQAWRGPGFEYPDAWGCRGGHQSFSRRPPRRLAKDDAFSPRGGGAERP